MKLSFRALAVPALLFCCGCYTTTVTSGRPAAPAAIAYDERTHNSVVDGLGELDGPRDLTAICPTGWAEIKTETSFPNFVASLFSGGLYTPQTITVRCALTAARPPALTSAPPPPPTQAPPPPSLPPPRPVGPAETTAPPSAPPTSP